MAQNLGIGDRPLENFEQENLGISSYGLALAQFVQRCDTPLTIGLQGDWGSGKTSLMNCIQHALENDKTIRKVWVNTWAYAQLGEESTLFLAVLEGVVDALAASAPPALKASIAKGFSIAKRVVLGAARVAIAAQGGDAGDALTGSGGERATHQLAVDMKQQLTELVQAAAGPGGRVVLFVDDLDRIPPPRAVQILEALKNFLDVPGLVTLLACDYGVISRGLTARMGVGEAELGRSFFDKIIQVPFRMPTHVYRATGYVRQLLRQVGVEVDDKLAGQMTDLMAASVGLNPRALKRHANTLLLLKLVAEQSPSLRDAMRDPHRPLVLLALIAMEAAYPGLHAQLARLLQSQDRDAVREFLDGSRIPNPKETDLTGLVESVRDGQVAWTPRVRIFLEHLSGVVDFDASGTLEDNEIDALQVLMMHSSVASVGAVPSRAPTADLVAEAMDLITQAATKDHRSAWITLLGAFGELGFSLKNKATCVHLRRAGLNERGGVVTTQWFVIYNHKLGPQLDLYGQELKVLANAIGQKDAWSKLDGGLAQVMGRKSVDEFVRYVPTHFATAEGCAPLLAVLREARPLFDADWTVPRS